MASDVLASRLLALPGGPLQFRITRKRAGNTEIAFVEHTAARSLPMLPRVIYARVQGILPPFDDDVVTAFSRPDDLALFALEALSAVVSDEPPPAPRNVVSIEPGNPQLEADDARVLAAGHALLLHQLAVAEGPVPLDAAFDRIELFLRGDTTARPDLARQLAVAAAFGMPSIVAARAWNPIMRTVAACRGKWGNVLSGRDDERRSAIRAAESIIEIRAAEVIPAQLEFERITEALQNRRAKPAELVAAAEALEAAKEAVNAARDERSRAERAYRSRHNRWRETATTTNDDGPRAA